MRVGIMLEEGKLGGPQVYVVNLVKGMGTKIDHLIIMPSENSKEFRLLCESSSIRYRLLTISRITKELRVSLSYVFFFPFEIARIAKVFRDENIDTVYVAGGSWQFKGVIAGRLANKRVLWHLNDTYTPKVIRIIFSWLSPLADGFIYASEQSKKYYGPLIRVNRFERVIPSSVDTNFFDSRLPLSNDELPQNWKGKLIVGTVANVSPVKGLETFIEMAADVNKFRKDVVFVVVGPVFSNQQNYHKKLLALCDNLGADNVEFIGSKSDVRPFLKRFDVYVCTSKAESSPISVWEAMSFGKAVVSTKVGDIPKYVIDGENGYIADVGDYASIARSVLTLFDNIFLKSRFEVLNRAIAVENFDVRHCVEKHIELYSACASSALKGGRNS